MIVAASEKPARCCISGAVIIARITAPMVSSSTVALVFSHRVRQVASVGSSKSQWSASVRRPSDDVDAAWRMATPFDWLLQADGSPNIP